MAHVDPRAGGALTAAKRGNASVAARQSADSVVLSLSVLEVRDLGQKESLAVAANGSSRHKRNDCSANKEDRDPL